METFWVVTLFHLQPTSAQWEDVQALALEKCEALGIEEFSLTEPEVDAILGERSYSGGDLPLSVLEEVEEVLQKRPGTYRFFFNDEKKAKTFFGEVKNLALCEAQIEKQETADWNAEWKKHYSPIEVNDKLTIVPSWQTDYRAKSEKQLLINPGMGFGTGSHETTFLCLKLFTELVVGSKIETVLDFGSGSGILGLATFLFYPDARVDFYDIDPEANKNCYQNAEINGLESKAFRLLLPEVRSQLSNNYDVVFANILENILVQEHSYLTEVSKRYLILSGLLKHQTPGIVELYSQQMKLIRQENRGDWSALLFEKEKE
jgi:ribosomal protein L11 methyltransferase